MESQKRPMKRPALKTLSTNSVLSNVHCQDESSTLSPIPRFRKISQTSSYSSSCHEAHESETLPSDWLFNINKDDFRPIKSISVSRGATCDDLLDFSKYSFLTDVDESSRGSDSGFGGENYPGKPRYDKQASVEAPSSELNGQSSVAPLEGSDSMDADDGFYDREDSENLAKANTTSLVFSPNPRFAQDSGRKKIVRSPFSLHRRPSTLAEENWKQSSNDDIGLIPSDEENESSSVNTTPKRKKSFGRKAGLKRSFSGYPTMDLSEITNSQEPLSFCPPFAKRKLESLAEKNKRNSFSRCHSEANIPDARMDEKKVDRMIEAFDNFSYAGKSSISNHLLPTCDRQRFELISVRAENVASLLQNKADNDHKLCLIDCRYPYEYNGGHVKGAINLHTEEQVFEALFRPALANTKMKEKKCVDPKDNVSITSGSTSAVEAAKSKPTTHSPLQCLKNHVNQSKTLIFYCEFSSRRAPNLAKYLRGVDRKANLYKYPYLFYPEIYIMTGGYHNFVQKFETLCEPRGYVKMFDKRFTAELGTYKRKTRKVRPEISLAKRSPISPLRLEQKEKKLSNPSPSSPPRAILFS